MTPGELRAFNAGIMMMVRLADEISAALVPAAVARSTRIEFARAALDGLAEEGRALLLPIPSIKEQPRP